MGTILLTVGDSGKSCVHAGAIVEDFQSPIRHHRRLGTEQRCSWDNLSH